MKFAIVLLALGCCAYVTHQQQHFMQRRYPLPYYYNFYYDFPAQMSRKNLMMRESPLFVVRNNYVQPYQYSSLPLNPSIEDQFAMLQNQMDGDNDSADDYYTSDNDFDLKEQQQTAQGRVPFRGLKNKVASDHDKDAARFFFLSSNYNLLSLFKTSTSTTFIFSTVTSTLTSATVQTCASAAQFISTTACRRRRTAEDFVPVAALAVSSSPVEPMEASVMPHVITQTRQGKDLLNDPASSSVTEIESSLQLDEENTESHRQKRSFLNKYIVVTLSSTVTITSYSISASTVTKSITLGIGGCAACVSCVPSGVTVC